MNELPKIFYYRDEEERKLIQTIMEQRSLMRDLHTRLEEVHDIASAACIKDYGKDERAATVRILKTVIFLPRKVSPAVPPAPAPTPGKEET